MRKIQFRSSFDTNLTSYIALYNYVMLNSNEPIKVAQLRKIANQSLFNSALVI